MNAVFFAAKRAFHSIVRLGRHPLAMVGLTAARFDLLYAIQRRPEGKILQSDLRRALGVTAPTVSRMVKSLELLGLVDRTDRPPSDRRQKWVALTDLGLAHIKEAIARLIGSGAAQFALDCALGFDLWYDTDDFCFTQMLDIESLLGAIRKAFGDRATLRYVWHPDD